MNMLLPAGANTLSGYEGAYNLYEQELRMNIVISQLEDIYDQLEEISTNQYMLYSAICESNNLLLEVANYTENDSLQYRRDHAQFQYLRKIFLRKEKKL